MPLITQNWIVELVRKRKEQKRQRAFKNIRSIAAYYRVDLTQFSDAQIERAILQRFGSIHDCSTYLDIAMSVYTKAQLALAWLRRGARQDG